MADNQKGLSAFSKNNLNLLTNIIQIKWIYFNKFDIQVSWIIQNLRYNIHLSTHMGVKKTFSYCSIHIFMNNM